MRKFEALSKKAAAAICAAVSVVVVCSSGSAAAPKADELVKQVVPHRAVYDLSLASPRGEGGVVEIDGRFEFEWNDVCDGWTVSQKSRFVVGRADGYDFVFGSSVSTWESKDGLRYRFFISRKQNGEETEKIRGVASLHESGGPGTARFTEPATETAALPEGTMFPTTHSMEILERAVAGDRVPYWAVLFDGTGEDGGISGVSATLVSELDAGEPGALEDVEALEDQPSWRIAMGYFGLGQNEAEPNQEQTIRMYRNGVVDFFSIDYGTFAFDASLVEFEELARPEC